MSAFMCSERHLSVLAVYAVQYGLDQCLDNRLEFDPLGREMACFRLLARENAASLDARYPGDRNCEWELMALEMMSRPRALTMDRVAVIKLCHCYAYQACEHSGWEKSRAKLIIDCIEAHAVRALPGYEKAPWSI